MKPRTQSFTLAWTVIFAALFLSACAVRGSAPPQVSTSLPPEIRISGSGSALPIVRRLAEAYQRQYPDTRFQFDEGTNSGGAIRGVIQQSFDIAVSDRPLTEGEQNDALVEKSFARDALVFAMHLPRPLRSLASADVRQIYSGSVSRWEQLGQAEGEIFVLTGNPNESARNELLIPIMENENIDARTIVLASAPELVRSLENTPNSVGYAPLGLLRLMETSKITPVALDGVVASAQTIESDAYPWRLTYSLIFRNRTRPQVLDFVDWIANREGRQVLLTYGYASPES
jgi:phosphate transport system substrate-binding protein